MRIGIICQNYPPAISEGGISHYTSHLVDGLICRGHQVIAISSTEFTHASGYEKVQNRFKLALVPGPWRKEAVAIIKRTARYHKLDFLILQYSPASFHYRFRVAWALAPMPCPKITAFHTLWGKSADRLIGILMLLGAQKVIATNSEVLFLIEKYLPYFLRKTYWVPIGSNIVPDRSFKQKPEVVPLISFFGMIYPGKGTDTILGVINELKELNYKFKFKFIGGIQEKGSGFERDLNSRIRHSGMTGYVSNTGLLPAEEVSTLISKSRFMLLPYGGGLSDRRGSFMAAIAHSKAVLTSPPAVQMKFIQNGIHAIWPEKRSTGAYTDIARKLLKEDRLIRRLESGAKELFANFGWDRIAGEYERVLRA